jgi:hypothetical protein
VTTGQHKDEGKLRYDLLPPDALREIVRILTYGSSKYADNNWASGIKYSRIFGSVMRHLWAWYGGEDMDKESGMNHLAHAGCDIMFLIAYVCRDMTVWDDRGK